MLSWQVDKAVLWLQVIKGVWLPTWFENTMIYLNATVPHFDWQASSTDNSDVCMGGCLWSCYHLRAYQHLSLCNFQKWMCNNGRKQFLYHWGANSNRIHSEYGFFPPVFLSLKLVFCLEIELNLILFKFIATLIFNRKQ